MGIAQWLSNLKNVSFMLSKAITNSTALNDFAYQREAARTAFPPFFINFDDSAVLFKDTEASQRTEVDAKNIEKSLKTTQTPSSHRFCALYNKNNDSAVVDIIHRSISDVELSLARKFAIRFHPIVV